MHNQCFSSIFCKVLQCKEYDSQCHWQNSGEQGPQFKFVSQSQTLQVTWSWPTHKNWARPREEGWFSALNLCIYQAMSHRTALQVQNFIYIYIHIYTYINFKYFFWPSFLSSLFCANRWQICLKSTKKSTRKKKVLEITLKCLNCTEVLSV